MHKKHNKEKKEKHSPIQADGRAMSVAPRFYKQNGYNIYCHNSDSAFYKSDLFHRLYEQRPF